MNKKTEKGRFKDFWAKVDKPIECWIWTGAIKKDKEGRCLTYGRAWYKGKQQKAHRVAWQIINGPIPAGMCILHYCDTPLCVRPTHLFLGTQRDNVDDMVVKGRQRNG